MACHERGADNRAPTLSKDNVLNSCKFIALLLCMSAVASEVWADSVVCPGMGTEAPPDRPSLELFASPYTYHWTASEEHRPVGAVSLSRLLPNDRFCGVSLFRNSFGQPSAYVFTGWQARNLWPAVPEVYGSLTAGIVYGYVGKYKDKVPLNVGGFSPVVIPALGYRLSPTVAVELQILGTAAVMFGTTVRF